MSKSTWAIVSVHLYCRVKSTCALARVHLYCCFKISSGDSNCTLYCCVESHCAIATILLYCCVKSTWDIASVHLYCCVKSTWDIASVLCTVVSHRPVKKGTGPFFLVLIQPQESEEIASHKRGKQGRCGLYNLCFCQHLRFQHMPPITAHPLP